MEFWPFTRERARRRALARRPAAPLDALLRAPLPHRRTPTHGVEFVALDLETTGLDAARDHILSVGLVHVVGNAIVLGTALHRVVRLAGSVPEASAVIHRITDDHAAAGSPIEEIMPRVLKHLRGRVMLVHHAAVESTFLDAVCRRLYGGRCIVPIVDTEHLARRRLERRHHAFKAGELRLANLRERYGLPRYQAHNALSDALATAELFLALGADMAPNGGLRLGDVLTH
ncbi:MAG: exonuclease domain-containing protein [Gammaproteobacteria bacterium]|nr:exonuclease domain-containing protein [Gammaproteobacteria bacterium]